MFKIPKYIQQKLLWYVVCIYIAVTVNFFIPRLMPGSPIDAILGRLGEHGAGGREIATYYAERFGLDKDLPTQYYLYLSNLIRGDLGPSVSYYPKRVTEILMMRLPWTIGLLSVTVIISWTLGNLIGAIIGWRRESRVNKGILFLNICLNQIPYYILAIILLYLFAFLIPIFPTSGGYNARNALSTETFSLTFMLDVLWHSILPALSIILVSIGHWLLSMRSLITSVMGSDYFLFAEVKGLKKNMVMMNYAFKNALLPQITSLGMQLGGMMSGSLIMERIFAFPGIGWTLIDAIDMRDYNLIQGIFLITTVSVLTANLLIDILYPLIDPRIRFEKRS